MDERKKMEACRMAEYVLTSKTKYAGELWRLLKFYNDNLDKAPPLPEEKPIDSLRTKIQNFFEKNRADMQELKKETRNLYKERTGQEWRPALTVVPNCGKAEASKSQGRHRRPILTVIQGGEEVMPWA